ASWLSSLLKRRTSRAVRPCEGLAKALRHKRRRKGGHVSAHRRDLTDERGRNRAKGGRGRKKDGLDFRRHRRVHGRHLDLVVEIGSVAQAPHDDRRPVPPGGLDREI